MTIDHTHDASARSWLASANELDCDFPIQNLPLTVFRRAGTTEQYRGGVGIGDQVIDLARLAQSDSLGDDLSRALADCAESTLNAFAASGPSAWRSLRHGLFALLSEDANETSVALLKDALVPIADIEHAIPFAIGDYSDFYTSIDHALNIGNLIRPDDPLTPNFRWMPIAYHGRVSSIGISGQEVYRPKGQMLSADSNVPIFGPCEKLDYELELGVFIGQPTQRGQTLTVDDAEDHLFGVCLLNDWSARDIQWWEMSPLGPFLSKNFATTLSPWIVTFDALAPYRKAWARTESDPQPLAHLSSAKNQAQGALDIQVAVQIQTRAQRDTGHPPTQISQTTFSHQYWTFAQMLTHHTSGGCPMNVGDLLGSGTISGPGEQEAGALIELSRSGQTPVAVGDGERRSFLENGDTVIFRGWCEKDGFARIGFGECRGSVVG
ncbi:fumarylacetoacetase [Burkholderia pseudomultivorans]|uniref:fumarylacetoacetase n=1 Tax=Burkholderia pseudomultivorans TaxID=1207504 RepID=UPI0009BE6812|nr:fumarylacetoacetase [Burkholderia pseudomultivorans]